MIGLLQISIAVYETALRENISIFRIFLTSKIQWLGRLLQVLFFQYMFPLTEQKMSHHSSILKSQGRGRLNYTKNHRFLSKYLKSISWPSPVKCILFMCTEPMETKTFNRGNRKRNEVKWSCSFSLYVYCSTLRITQKGSPFIQKHLFDKRGERGAKTEFLWTARYYIPAATAGWKI